VDDYETAPFYPEDDRFPVERGEECAHYDVARATGESCRD
jgi:hypothetical protein